METGGPFPYKQDGTIFRNKEGKLPEGDYREYTVDTPGANNRAKRRVVQDANSGRTYYAEDHYENFIQVDPIRR
ncbi:ribonuclease domain-containing protein [Pseudomonas sp. S3_C01]